MNDIDFGRRAQIDLLEHEDHVLEPGFLQEIQEFQFDCVHGFATEKTKKDDVGARHKIFRHHLVLFHHRVGAGRIDDVKIAQDGIGDSARQFRRNLGRFLFRSVAKNVNAVSCRQNIDLGKLISEEGIQQRRLSGLLRRRRRRAMVR